MYNINKTIEKFIVALTQILIVGTIAYLTENQLWLVLVPVLVAFQNWLKHYWLAK